MLGYRGLYLWVIFRPAGAKNDPQKQKSGLRRVVTIEHWLTT